MNENGKMRNDEVRDEFGTKGDRQSRGDFKRNSKKSSKQSKRGKRRVPKSEPVAYKQGKTASRTNDPAWYSLNPELLDRSTRIQFGTPTGHGVNLNGRFGPSTDQVGSATMATPGMAILTYAHGLGRCTGQANAVQASMFNLYATLRKSQTSYATFDPEDYMMYILAINEVYIFYSMLSRAYGLLNTYNVESMYLPKFLIEALGFDFEDLARNKIALMNLLDSIAAQINVFAVPDVLNYCTREFWLPSQVYADASTAKHQIYAFRPAYYRTWNELTEKGSKLDTIAYPWIKDDGTITDSYTRLTVAKCQEIATRMLTALHNSQDVGVMSANVRQAYGDSLWRLTAFDANYTIMPICDYNVLSQIENATLAGPASSLEDFDIKQDPTLNDAHIIYNPTFKKIGDTIAGVAAPGSDSRLFDRVVVEHVSDVTSDLIMESTRFVVGGVETQNSVDLVYGTETLAAITIYSSVDDVDTPIRTQGALYTSSAKAKAEDAGMISPAYNPTNNMEFLVEAKKFDWFPRLYLGVPVNEADTKYWEMTPILDLDNFAIVQKSDLEQLHYVAILSMFNVKTTG